MAQILVTLSFVAVMVFAARSILRELARPLVNGPACWDDALYDALCDGRGGGMPLIVSTRTTISAPVRLPQPIAAAA